MTVSSVLVVGGGIAGVSTVAELRKQGYVGELTLVSVDPFPYDRPPLSKEYLAGRRSSTRSRCRLRSGTPSSGST